MIRLSTLLYFLAIACYVASFLMPTFEIGETPQYGYTALMVAFLAIKEDMVGGPLVFLMGLSNPAFWAGAVFFIRGYTWRALGASCLALLLGCRFVFGDLILIGYFVWLGGMTILILASVTRLLHRTPDRG